MNNRFAELRRDYGSGGFGEDDASPDPFRQFGAWLGQANDAGLIEPNAMTLATASVDGRPSARIVLLRDYGEGGFTFFTNYESRKGRELAENPWAALVFYWPELERQVRVEGQVSQVAPRES